MFATTSFLCRHQSSSSSSAGVISFSSSSILPLVFVLLLVTITSLSFAQAKNFCSPVTFKNGSKVSFFDVPNANFLSLQQIGLGGHAFQFSLKVCDPDSVVPNAPQQCPGSFLSQTGCDVTFTIMEDKFPHAVFDEYILIKYESKSKGLDWTANVRLICNLNVKDKIVCPQNQYDATQTGGSKGPVFLTFEFESSAFCTDASRGGLPTKSPNNNGNDNKDDGGFRITWGVVFLISLFGPLILYLLIMIIWNCKEGKRGSEVCPNFDFWRSLPGLALDGVTFLWSKVRGSHWESCDNNYGDGASGREVGSYNSVY